jgi:hypothetical protein
LQPTATASLVVVGSVALKPCSEHVSRSLSVHVGASLPQLIAQLALGSQSNDGVLHAGLLDLHSRIFVFRETPERRSDGDDDERHEHSAKDGGPIEHGEPYRPRAAIGCVLSS